MGEVRTLSKKPYYSSQSTNNLLPTPQAGVEQDKYGTQRNLSPWLSRACPASPRPPGSPRAISLYTVLSVDPDAACLPSGEKALSLRRTSGSRASKPLYNQHFSQSLCEKSYLIARGLNRKSRPEVDCYIDRCSSHNLPVRRESYGLNLVSLGPELL